MHLATWSFAVLLLGATAEAKPHLFIGVGSPDAGRLDPHLTPSYAD